MAEVVYVLTNEAMPGIVKIGMTSTFVEQRIRELDTTALPLPFQCFFAAEVRDASIIEKRLHRVFSDKRIRGNREFFRVDANQVREAILIADPKEVTPRNDVLVEASDAEALQRAVATEERRSRLRFSELGIGPGAILEFAKDRSITCEVVSDGKVKFQGEVVSPSKAALVAVKSLGYNWSAVSGSDFWEYNGDTLTAIRMQREDEGSET